MIKVLVCGGRDYIDSTKVFSVLKNLCQDYNWNVHIIQGGARGADNLAQEFAIYYELGQTIYPADWKEHGKAAGPIRNQLMLDAGKPDLVIAFPGGRGTADMIRRAELTGVEVRQIDEDYEDYVVYE